jgi:hypothetical protein
MESTQEKRNPTLPRGDSFVSATSSVGANSSKNDQIKSNSLSKDAQQSSPSLSRFIERAFMSPVPALPVDPDANTGGTSAHISSSATRAPSTESAERNELDVTHHKKLAPPSTQEDSKPSMKPSVTDPSGSNTKERYLEQTNVAVSNLDVGDLTTGLLSLSVHEPLTFNGTKVALHPDLFSAFVPMISAALEAYKHQEEKRRQEMMEEENQQQTRLRSNSNLDCPPPTIKAAIPSKSSASTLSRYPHSETSTDKSLTIIKEGDFIEVRVWDPASADSWPHSATHNVSTFSSSMEATDPSAESDKERPALQIGTVVYFPSTDGTSTGGGGQPPSSSKHAMEALDGSHAPSTSDNSRPYRLRDRFVMSVGTHTLSSIKENSRSQISVLKQGEALAICP